MVKKNLVLTFSVSGLLNMTLPQGSESNFQVTEIIKYHDRTSRLNVSLWQSLASLSICEIRSVIDNDISKILSGV